MLMPRKIRHRKQQRGRLRGMAKGGTRLSFGDYGIQAVEPGWLTNRQIEAARIAMTRHIKRGGKVWINVFPDKPVLERTSMNSWDDKKVRDALKANGRNKVVVSGLWVEVCNNTFALSAMLEGGYEIYMVADASGGTSKEAHDYAMQRMIQVGVVPVTWQQVLLEWQRDWARKETYDAVMAIVREHSGAYGMGVDYAYTMVHKAPQRTSKVHEALPPVAA